MTHFYSRIVLTICFCTSILSIRAQDCGEKIRKSNEQYDKKDFRTALKTFQSAIAAKCPLNEFEYYNGACIASLAGQTNLAISYLSKSVAKGYLDTVHMAKDADLDYIRKTEGYKNILATIRLKYAELQTELAKLRPDYYNEMIPYSKGGKWGWLDRSSLKPVTKPIFNYTDFSSMYGLYFVFGWKPYIITRYGEVEPAPDYADDGMDKLSIAMAQPETANIEGFDHDGRSVTSFSNKYSDASLVQVWDIMSKLAIVTDHSGNKAVIAMNGAFVPPFDLRHTEIHHFGNTMLSAIFLTKKPGDTTYQVYDVNSKLIPVNGITDFDFPWNYQRNAIDQTIYVGYYYHFIVTRGGGRNVFDAEEKKLLFPKDFKEILFINGPTDDSQRKGSPGNRGIKQRYFYVSDGSRSFYVDGSGSSYIPK